VKEIIGIYRRSFAEPPWNESWTKEQVIEEMMYSLSSKNPIMLVAEMRERITGFMWGCALLLERFPFLQGRLKDRCIYGAEIAVDRQFRKLGVGSKLLGSFLLEAKRCGFGEFVCRTDVNNRGSMGLFRSLGLSEMGIYDPQFSSRVYLRKELDGLSADCGKSIRNVVRT
jgi:ribosomal protein S18 acetylase RimI-like enzyme